MDSSPSVYPGKTADGKCVVRTPVPFNLRPWKVPCPGYSPVYYSNPARSNQPWADDDANVAAFPYNKPDSAGILRMSHDGPYDIDPETGAPLNPRGRTGVRGPGSNGRYGPNHAADLLCTRTITSPSGMPQFFIDGSLMIEAALVTRRDNKKLAFPGGFCNAHETAKHAALREWFEEARDSLRTVDKDERMDSVQDDGLGVTDEYLREFMEPRMKIVYGGQMSDDRNTDNAWIESTVFAVHDGGGSMFSETPLTAGDDAEDAQWVLVTPAVLDNMHAGHEVHLHKVLAELTHENGRYNCQACVPPMGGNQEEHYRGCIDDPESLTLSTNAPFKIELNGPNYDCFDQTLVSWQFVRDILGEAVEPLIPKSDLGYSGMSDLQKEAVADRIREVSHEFTDASLPYGCAESLAERFAFFNSTKWSIE